ncbi:MAG: DUF6261 family protein [Odoribacteraceae bacterium]|jgi:uncharacterized protein YejL (UPF0352 family)|nr:DUF6261 family protein [Odoribacteraceae bacterium]
MYVTAIFIIIQYRRLRHETFVQFLTEFIALVEKHGAGAIGFKAAYDELKAKYDVMLAALDALFKSGITAKLKEQDRFRDSFVFGLTTLARSFLRHSDAAKRDAATQLMIAFDHYKQLARKRYEDESAALNDLIRELTSAKFAPHVATLGLGALVTLLAEANAMFFSLVQERHEEEMQRPTVPMKEARAAAEEALRAVLARAEASATLLGLDSNPDLAAFVTEYNLIATHYKQILAVEQGRRKAAAGKDENDDDEWDEEVEIDEEVSPDDEEQQQ